MHIRPLIHCNRTILYSFIKVRTVQPFIGVSICNYRRCQTGIRHIKGDIPSNLLIGDVDILNIFIDLNLSTNR